MLYDISQSHSSGFFLFESVYTRLTESCVEVVEVVKVDAQSTKLQFHEQRIEIRPGSARDNSGLATASFDHEIGWRKTFTNF